MVLTYVRIGPPYYDKIEHLIQNSDFFRSLNDMSPDDRTTAITAKHGVLSKDGDDYSINFDSNDSKRDKALECLFNIMTTDGNSTIAFLNEGHTSCFINYGRYSEQHFSNYDILEEVNTLLDEFKVSDVIRERYHAWFPYFSTLEYEKAPHGNANQKGVFSTTEYDKTYKRSVEVQYSGWELLKKQKLSEGERCKQCRHYNPWCAPLASQLICRCRYYRNDWYKRTEDNPYFDDDNYQQREHDYNDALRRQD